MQRKRLLIVDDEPRFATFVERVAEPLGYEVEVTNHGRDFQAAYRRKLPDIVVIRRTSTELSLCCGWWSNAAPPTS